MTYSDLKAAFRGVNFVTPTPFTGGGEEVDHEGIRENITALEREGARLLIPCGGVSEYYSLSTEERANVVRTTVEAVDDETQVVGGVSGSPKNAVDLIDRYERAGADGIMIIFPPHPGMHERGLLRYYQKLAASTDLGVMIYWSDPRLTADVFTELVTEENVVAVKYALNDDIREFIRAIEIDDDVVWVNGNAEEGATAMAVEGAEGFTTGIGNFVPELSLALMDALRTGDWERAQRIRDLASPIQRLRQEAGENNALPGANSIPVVKYGMELAGLNGGPVREPFVDLPDDDKERLRTHYETIQEADL